MNIIDEIGQPAMLEQLAEECCELAQASLKMSRILRGENPTPKTGMQCLESLTEEIADVMTCLEELRGMVDMVRVEAVKDQKRTRWCQRIKKRRESK